MINLTKEKIESSRDEEIPKWRERKTKWTLCKEFVSGHKLLVAAIVCLSICIVFNIVLIYNFFRILAIL